ncbi:MAG: histidinol-phosphate aminotransferase family protein [Peptococcaceae bacterium]|jgi:histidinol-phosphate aminotransferase|nr:histidinol-phosphate aminotransferase family protein [Peptococcaceae bacterium]
MGYQLSEKVRGLKPYTPVAGRCAVRLDANESFVALPPDLRRKIYQAAKKADFRRYPDHKAAKCCKAFAAYYGIQPGCLTAGSGSDELISLILNGFFSRGEKIALAEPDFSMYEFYARGAELEMVRYQKRADYRIDPVELAALVRQENCRGLIFSNPCNPTSQGLRKMAVRNLVRSLPETLIILDEAYMDFWNQTLLTEVEDYDNLIILRTCSKAISSAALRLGFAAAAKKLTKALGALKSPYNVNSLTQEAGTVILKRQDVLREALTDILAGRGFLAGALAKLEQDWAGSPWAFHLLPESRTNFVAICFPAKETQDRMFQYLKSKSVLVRNLPGILRVTVGAPEENQLFLEAFKSAQASGLS